MVAAIECPPGPQSPSVNWASALTSHIPAGRRTSGAVRKDRRKSKSGSSGENAPDFDSGAFIGCAGLNPTEGGLELGYWIGEPYWGRGFATEAAHALVDLAFRATGVGQLNVSCRVSNPASRRVIHKCGFQYAGQGMIHSLAAGQVAVERYSLDRKTWVSLRSWAAQ